MTEPGPGATDAELADHYDRHRDLTDWSEPHPVQRPERLDVTISVRFTPAEIATIRARAEAAALKPTAYIRRCALAHEQPPIDRGQLSRTVAALTQNLEDLRRAAS
ncbi:MAG: plasmid mobilization protein [Pseudonocardiaceae bacterium]